MIDYHPDVLDAKKNAQPIIALESTIITHGMPYPENLHTAEAVENAIRDEGALPATIAVIDGKLKIGLQPSELERLAQSGDCLKLSRADFAFAIASKKTGSTTVAATMIAAALAEIAFFATGGIGGVHQGGQSSMDISADLNELARSPVNVVCAGAKAILDIPRTLEYLETAGVPVVVFDSDEVPAFWSRDSGIAAPLRLNTYSDISRFIDVHRTLGMQGGVLIMNPIPAGAEIPKPVIDELITRALALAQEADISGKAVTPYLLQKINDLSNGKSLLSNIELIKNNAKLAAKLAVQSAR